MAEFSAAKPCRILSLDGGGAKGFYTIGVLKGLEGLLGAPLHKHFDLVFGTSTGSIIAALICLGQACVLPAGSVPLHGSRWAV